jgi:hypothetical protein
MINISYKRRFAMNTLHQLLFAAFTPPSQQVRPPCLGPPSGPVMTCPKPATNWKIFGREFLAEPAVILGRGGGGSSALVCPKEPKLSLSIISTATCPEIVLTFAILTHSSVYYIMFSSVMPCCLILKQLACKHKYKKNVMVWWEQELKVA